MYISTSARSSTGSEHRNSTSRVEGSNPSAQAKHMRLASFIGTAVGGAVKSCLDAHPHQLSSAQRDLLIGSVRKRAVNQITCKAGVDAIIEALGEGERV